MQTCDSDRDPCAELHNAEKRPKPSVRYCQRPASQISHTPSCPFHQCTEQTFSTQDASWSTLAILPSRSTEHRNSTRVDQGSLVWPQTFSLTLPEMLSFSSIPDVSRHSFLYFPWLLQANKFAFFLTFPEHCKSIKFHWVFSHWTMYCQISRFSNTRTSGTPAQMRPVPCMGLSFTNTTPNGVFVCLRTKGSRHPKRCATTTSFTNLNMVVRVGLAVLPAWSDAAARVGPGLVLLTCTGGSNGSTCTKPQVGPGLVLQPNKCVGLTVAPILDPGWDLAWCYYLLLISGWWRTGNSHQDPTRRKNQTFWTTPFLHWKDLSRVLPFLQRNWFPLIRSQPEQTPRAPASCLIVVFSAKCLFVTFFAKPARFWLTLCKVTPLRMTIEMPRFWIRVHQSHAPPPPPPNPETVNPHNPNSNFKQ